MLIMGVDMSQLIHAVLLSIAHALVLVGVLVFLGCLLTAGWRRLV